MTVRDPKELFNWMLSNVRQGAEHATTVYQELSEKAERPEVKEALQARAFVSNKMLSTLDECFKMTGMQPMSTGQRLQEIFLEDFRSEFQQIESPEARAIFVLIKANHLNSLRIGELWALVETADAMGHYGVGTLLSSVLGDKIAFAEHTKHLLRNLVQGRMEMRRAA